MFDVASAQLQRLSREFDETCYLAKLDGETVRSVVMESPGSPWRGYVLPGRSMMAHANASAKAIIAYQDDALIERALESELPALTPFTKTDRDEIRREFVKVRDAGFATCIDEVEEGLAAFAVPIFGQDGSVQMALASVGPKARIMGMLEGGAVERFSKTAASIALSMRLE